MLTDPQSLTINGVATSFPTVTRGDSKSVYRVAGGDYELVTSSNFGKRDRILARLNQTKTAADPLSAVNAEVSQSVYVVLDRPAWGFTSDETEYLVAALSTWLTANACAITERLISGET